MASIVNGVEVIRTEKLDLAWSYVEARYYVNGLSFRTRVKQAVPESAPSGLYKSISKDKKCSEKGGSLLLKPR